MDQEEIEGIVEGLIQQNVLLPLMEIFVSHRGLLDEASFPDLEDEAEAFGVAIIKKLKAAIAARKS